MIDFTAALTDEILRSAPAGITNDQLIRETIQYLDNNGIIDHVVVQTRYSVIPVDRVEGPTVQTVLVPAAPPSSAAIAPEDVPAAEVATDPNAKAFVAAETPLLSSSTSATSDAASTEAEIAADDTAQDTAEPAKETFVEKVEDFIFGPNDIDRGFKQ
jgi:hypothetical protein